MIWLHALRKGRKALHSSSGILVYPGESGSREYQLCRSDNDARLGATSYLYGWAAGIFFFAYTAFEISSKLILAGRRAPLDRPHRDLLGLLSALTAIAVGPTSLIVILLLLGARSRFFPGIIPFLRRSGFRTNIGGE